uniref:Uncharacterized protein n=1 Tax=Panstrongylus lignarius TaxID=156445 RepID=A0A224Y140_9HEMI
MARISFQCDRSAVSLLELLSPSLSPSTAMAAPGKNVVGLYNRCLCRLCTWPGFCLLYLLEPAGTSKPAL